MANQKFESMRTARMHIRRLNALRHDLAVTTTLETALLGLIDSRERAARAAILQAVDAKEVSIKGQWDFDLRAAQGLDADDEYQELKTRLLQARLDIANLKAGVEYHSQMLRLWTTVRETAVANLQFAASLGTPASILQTKPMLPSPDGAG